MFVFRNGLRFSGSAPTESEGKVILVSDGDDGGGDGDGGGGG